MADPFKPGDHVKWGKPGSEITGVVDRKITSDVQIKGHHAKASQDCPQWIVKSDNTGAEAAHTAEELTKIS